jgi:hypothetical protein
MMRAAARIEQTDTRNGVAAEALRHLLGAFLLTIGLDTTRRDATTLESVWTLLRAFAGSAAPVTVLESIWQEPIDSPGNPDYGELVETFAWLEDQIEVRTPRELAFHRVLRLAICCALLCAGACWLFWPQNLAYRKPVTMSSRCSTMPPAPLYAANLSRAVDGVVIERNYAVCTNTEQRPWVTVNLLDEYAISKIVVYDRNDCCWNDADTPLSVQLSTDNKQFTTVGTTTEIFSPGHPWIVELGGQPARFVRLIVDIAVPKNITISEIEVFGRSN